MKGHLQTLAIGGRVGQTTLQYRRPRMGGVRQRAVRSTSTVPGSKVDIYFIDCPHFFHRNQIYTNDLDEGERFALFSKAVIEAMQRLQWAPDVVHCNDWHSGALVHLLKPKTQKALPAGRQVKANVEFLGHIEPDKISEYLARSDIFVRPSRSEGLGSSFLRYVP